MPVISEKLNRWLLVVAALLLMPNAFYWTAQSGYGAFDAYSTIFSDTYSSIIVGAYLSIFIAIASRNLKLRAIFTVGAFLANIYYWVFLTDAFRGSEVAVSTQLRALFINSPGHAPFAAFQTLSVILLGFLAYSQREHLSTHLSNMRAFIADASHRLHVSIWTILTGLSVAGVVVLAYMNIKDHWDSSDKVWMLVIQILLLLVRVALELLTWSVILWASIHWVSHIVQIIDDLRDFKINQYITRKLSAYIYTAYSVGILLFAAIAIPAAAFGEFVPLTQEGVHLVDWLIFPLYFAVGTVVTFFALIVWRILVEFTVSLIHIAENTRKN